MVRPGGSDKHPRRDCSTFFISLSKAEGYAEGDLTLYHRTSVTDFLRAANPVDFLSKASEVSPQTLWGEMKLQNHGLEINRLLSLPPQISLDDEELAQHPATTEDVRVCCQDIKVLGRKELRYALGVGVGARCLKASKAGEGL